MKKLILFLFLIPFLNLHADEGMWMLGNLSKQTQELMKELGLQMSATQLYSTDQPSLKDAVVSFGGFCSGVVVSEDGLVFTNHHCGFGAIQQHSTVEHDYLKDGFVAKNNNEELPNPDLYVSFLVSSENVTKRVLGAVTPDMNEGERKIAIDSIALLIQDEVVAKDSTLRGIVDPYYGGNEYYLSIYKDYNDVRLVFAPPSSVGKFGGDTDNWVWPRHTGDFSVFRIYAGKNNEPADYSPDNVPYHPEYVAPVSLGGYQPGSFCMTIGYPGSTERYLSSWGVENRMMGDNMARIDVRGVKQEIWKRAMEANDSIRIKYSSKYATSSNYWKNSIGMNKAIKELGVLEKKRMLEKEVLRWIQQKPEERSKYMQVLTNLQLNYNNIRDVNRAIAYFGETFINAPELVEASLIVLNFDFSDDNANIEQKKKQLMDIYKDMDLALDKEVFIAMLKDYKEKVDSIYLPEVYNTIRDKYKNDYRKYADYLYSHSSLTTPEAFNRLLKHDKKFSLFDDPAASLVIDLLVKLFEMKQQVGDASLNIEENERLLTAAIMEMYADHNFYPDANSTMRLSLGVVGGYSPRDAVDFSYYTTTKGIFEKVREYKGDSDFEVQPDLLALLAKKDFGRYADSTGQMNVCFISDNDITGGNSGSAMFNGKGELIGLAFDGNWEGMSGDLIFEKKFQKTIGVDIRYVLYMIDKYGHATHLIDELKLIK